MCVGDDSSLLVDGCGLSGVWPELQYWSPPLSRDAAS